MSQFPTIGFISNWPVYQGTTIDHYAHSLIQGISTAAREKNLNLLLGCGFSVTGKSPQHHIFWPVPGPGTDFVPVGPWNTDGLIIVPDELTNKQLHYVRDLLDSGFPVIFTTPEGPGPLVSVDNIFGIRSAFSHLLKHGRKRVAFIAGNPGRSGDSEERLRAYHEALSEAGLPFEPELCAYGAHRREGGAAAMQQILSSGQPFDALIASNDLSCIGAMEVMQKAGLRIPEDVAVIGFDDILEARSFSPSLTTIRHPTFSLGYQAVVTLLEYIQGKRQGNAKVIVPTRLITRESCGCRSGEFTLRAVQFPQDAIINEMAEACFAEARNTPLDEFRSWSALFLAGILESCRKRKCEPILDVVEQGIQWADAHEEDIRVCQGAASILIENLKSLAAINPDLDSTYAALCIDRARQEISERIQQHAARSMVRYTEMTSQLGQFTAEILSAMSIEQTAEILARHLPKLGIKNALVTLYDTSSEDLTSQGKVLFGAGFERKFNGLSFNPRAFPIAEIYSAEHPFQITILPLTIDQNLLGFVAFDAPNPEMCAALVYNLSAALRTSRLYQDALEGRKMAEEANRLKSRFLSMVSHELRTPLSLIVGLSEMSIRNGSADLHDIEQINLSAQHLSRLIGDVLDLASSEAGQLRILREPLDFASVLEVTAKIGAQMAKEKGLSWKANYPEKGPWILGDKTRLRQVLLNLINNAIKFTSNGEIVLEVNVQNDQVVVSVSDTGIGIASSEIKAVFNEFYRSERSIESGIGGMGLGLVITRQLIEKHGGHIEVHSPGDLGCGTTFVFTLPILSQPETMEDDQLPLPINYSTVVILAQKNDNVQNIENFLSERCFNVRVLYIDEKIEWLSQVKSSSPIAVIITEQLAERESWAIANIIKRQPSTENILVYAYSLHQNSDHGELLEINYLQKPINSIQLEAEFKNLLVPTESQQTILIVDDDPGILNMHSRLVEQTGRKTLIAHNGKEAFSILSNSHPNLILLDLNMPEMDGFEVLEELHKREDTRDIPVIIITARLLSDEDLQRCNHGVASILGKGLFNTEETLERIDAALSRRNSLGGATRILVRKAMAYINTHCSEMLTREQIASYAGISADYLTTCFHQELGITPIIYIRRYRIHQACELLRNSDLSITQIAMKVGFCDSAHFSKTFLKEMGVTPKAYRRKND